MASGIINTFNPDIHIVRDCSLIKDLQEKLKEPNLVAIYMIPTKVWAICCWVRKERGWFSELLYLADPGDFSREEFNTLDAWVHNRLPTVQDAKKQIQAEERDMDRRWAEDNNEALAQKQHIGKMLGGVEQYNPEWQNPGFQVHQ